MGGSGVDFHGSFELCTTSCLSVTFSCHGIDEVCIVLAGVGWRLMQSVSGLTFHGSNQPARHAGQHDN